MIYLSMIYSLLPHEMVVGSVEDPLVVCQWKHVVMCSITQSVVRSFLKKKVILHFHFHSSPQSL